MFEVEPDEVDAILAAISTDVPMERVEAKHFPKATAALVFSLDAAVRAGVRLTRVPGNIGLDFVDSRHLEAIDLNAEGLVSLSWEAYVDVQQRRGDAIVRSSQELAWAAHAMFRR